MRVFVSVVDQGSFTASAKRLNLSQPSVSRKVSALEEHLGIRLLHRSTRSLSLTEAGKVYYEKVRRIQESLTDAEASISGFKENPSGLLRFSSPVLWAEKMIIPRLAEFLELYPGIELDMECSDDILDLVEDRLDLVIRIGDLRDTSHIMIPFGKVRLRICATPRYLETHPTPENDIQLQTHRFALYKNFEQLVLSRGTCTKTVRVKSLLKSNNISVLLHAVHEHCGLAVLPEWAIESCLSQGRLEIVMPEHEVQVKNLSSDNVFALYSSRTHLPAKVRAFIDFFRP